MKKMNHIEKKTITPLKSNGELSSSQPCEICKLKEYEHIHHKDLNHKNNKKENLQYLCTLCHAKIHGIEPRRSELKDKVVLLNRYQKRRIVVENLIRGFGRIEMKVPDEFEEESKKLRKIEKEIAKEIKDMLIGNRYHQDNDNQNISVPFPIYSWLKTIKGIGPLHSAKLIAYIDMDKTPTVSALWAYCGLTPDSKKTKGKKANWNQQLKMYCFQISESFIKSKSSYKKIYDKEKERQLMLMKDNHAICDTQKCCVSSSNNNLGENQEDNLKPLLFCSPPKSLMHCHMRAMRKMIKEFLKDYWIECNNQRKTIIILKPDIRVSPSDN